LIAGYLGLCFSHINAFDEIVDCRFPSTNMRRHSETEKVHFFIVTSRPFAASYSVVVTRAGGPSVVTWRRV
jgi:hypothetical protein